RADVTATTTDGTNLSATCKIIVLKKATSLTLNKTELELHTNETATLTAKILPSDATIDVVEWSSTDSSIVSVDDDGNVTALSAGTAYIEAATIDGSELVARCKVTVLDIKATSISLNETKLELYVNDTANLTATVLPTNTTVKTVEWRSTSSSVASIDNAGKVTALKPGSTIIEAVTTDGSNLVASCQVTVYAIPDVKGITLNCEKNIVLAVGETTGFSYTIDASSPVPSNAVKITNSNPEVAVITSENKIKALQPGQTKITVSCYDVEESVTVSVYKSESDANARTLIEYIIKNGTHGTDVNDAEVYTCKVGDTIFSYFPEEDWINFRTVYSENNITFYIVEATIFLFYGNTTIMSVSRAESSGHWIAEADYDMKRNDSNTDFDFTAVIQKGLYFYNSDKQKCNQYAKTSIQRYDDAVYAAIGLHLPDITWDIQVNYLNVSDDNIAIPVGGTYQIETTVGPSTAYDKTVMFMSSDPNIATVEEDGTIHGISKGVTTIIAVTRSAGLRHTITVSVGADPIKSITLNKNKVTLQAREIETLTATINPADSASLSVEWKSSNPNVVIVDENGRLVGVGEGRATVTVSAKYGNAQAQCEVEVKKLPYTNDAVRSLVSLIIQNGEITENDEGGQTFTYLMMDYENDEMTTIQYNNANRTIWFTFNESNRSGSDPAQTSDYWTFLVYYLDEYNSKQMVYIEKRSDGKENLLYDDFDMSYETYLSMADWVIGEYNNDPSYAPSKTTLLRNAQE
ncbi:MAG: Ig-like domain-containing protein, partial [Erysipelotrichaceae bacterium]|nr:Ig-like domain-containing protein [Erysipelotrichaceae bacterium]